IRDFHVTGVQTCALPILDEYQGIYNEELRFVQNSRPNDNALEQSMRAKLRISQYAVEGSILAASDLANAIYLNSEYPTILVWKKIGRASCRERVKIQRVG